jgi:hypothetical protein
MKKIFLLVSLLAALCVGAICFAENVPAPRESDETTANILQKMTGTWYYTNGSEALVITPTAISGASVEGGYGFVGGDPGSGIFKVLLHGMESDLRIGWHFASKDGSHQYLFFNGRALRRNISAQYSESIGDVYLGMSREDVLNTLGRPDQEDKMKKLMYYPKKGLTLGFDNGIVYDITIDAKAGLTFNNSALQVNSPLSEFQRRYGLPKLPIAGNDGGPNRIGDGEYLWFTNYPNSIMLSLYNT